MFILTQSGNVVYSCSMDFKLGERLKLGCSVYTLTLGGYLKPWVYFHRPALIGGWFCAWGTLAVSLCNFVMIMGWRKFLAPSVWSRDAPEHSECTAIKSCPFQNSIRTQAKKTQPREQRAQIWGLKHRSIQRVGWGERNELPMRSVSEGDLQCPQSPVSRTNDSWTIQKLA